jgi:hypothetical protein
MTWKVRPMDMDELTAWVVSPHRVSFLLYGMSPPEGFIVPEKLAPPPDQFRGQDHNPENSPFGRTCCGYTVTAP